MDATPPPPSTSPAPAAPGRRHVPGWHLHRRLYDWVLHWADTPYGGPALFIMSFAESSFFPIPPDVLLAPLVLGNRRKWFGYALSCSIASVFGGILGYAIGAFLWLQLGNLFHDHVPGFTRDTITLRDGTHLEGLIDHKSLEVTLPAMKAEVEYPAGFVPKGGERRELTAEQVAEVHVQPFSKTAGLYEHYSFWIVFIAGFTPLPYKVITITAGVFEINFFVFVIASAVSRAARFFLVAGLMGLFGEKIKPIIDRYFNVLCIAFVVLLIGGFYLLKYVG